MLEIRVTIDDTGHVTTSWPENYPGTCLAAVEQLAQEIRRKMVQKEMSVGRIVTVNGAALDRLRQSDVR